MNGVLLQPLSYPDPDRLLRIYETSPEFSCFSVAYPNFLDWRAASRSFTDMGAGEPEQLAGEYVSAGLLPVLGVTPFLGRAFLPEEDRQGAACSVKVGWLDRPGGRRRASLLAFPRATADPAVALRCE